MKELNNRLAERLKPLQKELDGYKIKYSVSFDSVTIELKEQNLEYVDFVPISNKFFYKKANGGKVEVYVRVLQTTEIGFDRLKEIFDKVEKSLLGLQI